ncbi:hypothetical protein CLU79DRAFT_749587 [Phycomyces nitens]|nr:hypothetical protein CLU79DRAFT_749587 [Phycomyces nitens]
MNSLCQSPSFDHDQEEYSVEMREALAAEQAYFGEYDRAVAEQFSNECCADDYDYYSYDYEQDCVDQPYGQMYSQEEQEQEYNDEDEAMDYEKASSNPDYQNDALLNLVVGVQSYLSDMTTQPIQHVSPLLDLQYKMYIYLKQRAIDMGLDTQALD